MFLKVLLENNYTVFEALYFLKVFNLEIIFSGLPSEIMSLDMHPFPFSKSSEI